VVIARAEISGLVLAGGRGQRFGGADKGWIDYDGRALIEIACERLRPQVSALLISANRHLDRYAALAPVVRDDAGVDVPAPASTDPRSSPAPVPFDGPLAGILAALASCRTPWLAVVPCDAPRFPLDLVPRLAAAVGDAAAACACADGRVQPLFALLHRRLHGALAGALARGERRVLAWLDAVEAVHVDFADAAAFANLNTPAELAAERAAAPAAARGADPAISR
jgi:molybdopterin-guanine dinucleotide biosynthesis protein A